MFGWLFGKESKPGAGGTTTGARPRPRGPKVNLSRRFTIVAETGQGSMSKVYRAVDNQSGRVVCLKVQDVPKAAAAGARASATGRESEGQIGLKLVHPHVVRTLEHGYTTGGEHFILMEFVDGVSLTLARQSRVLDLPTKLELLAQAAEGLAAVHAAGFIHRDVGPKNLLVDREDQVKVIDFGLAVPNTPEFHRPGNRTGTLTYMAPELVRREATDERIDIFAFGATAFEFLTGGKLPYDGDPRNAMAVMQQRLNQDPTPLAQVAPKLPPELCAIIDKTLAKRPQNRWPKMSTLPAALRAIAPLRRDD